MALFRPLLIFFCLASACFAQHTPRPVANVPIPTFDGKTIHIPQYKGKVVMIVLMLTTCEPCHQTLEFLTRLQHEMGPRGFQAVAISLDPDVAVVKPYAERYRYPFPVGHLDRDPAITLLDLKKTAQPTVPYIVYVDWMGAVRFQYPANDPIFNQGEKGLRTIADGLLRQAAEKKGAQYETRPATKK